MRLRKRTRRKIQYLPMIAISLIILAIIKITSHDIQIALRMFTRPSLTQTKPDTFLKDTNIAPNYGEDFDAPYEYVLRHSPVYSKHIGARSSDVSHEPGNSKIIQAEIALKPDFGTHRFYEDAVFTVANTMRFKDVVFFVRTLQKSGFEGDIVLSVNLDKPTNVTDFEEKLDRQNLEKFLKSNSENGGNVVVYNGVIRSDDTDETFSHQMNATKDYTYLRGLYKVRNGNAVFEDERIPRSIGVARFELFWVWSQQYSPESRLLLIDGHDTFFQRAGEVGIGSRHSCTHANTTKSYQLHIYEENNKGMKHRLNKIQNKTMLLFAYKNRAVMGFIYNENVLTPASTHGHQRAVDAYLRAMVKHFDITQCAYYRCEWAFHNYLFYTGALWSTPGIDEIIPHMQGTGAVNSIRLDVPLNESKMYDARRHIVFNRPMGDGIQPSWAVHQYQEDKDLAAYIEGQKDDMLKDLDYSKVPILKPAQVFDPKYKDCVISIKPTLGAHRHAQDAIFSIIKAKDFDKVAWLIVSARRVGFEGDIVLHTPRLDFLSKRISDFLKDQARNNNVVIYEDYIRSNETKWILHHAYAESGSDRYVNDRRPPRAKAVVSIDLFKVWIEQYDESSLIMVLDGERAYFQSNPFDMKVCSAFELYTQSLVYRDINMETLAEKDENMFAAFQTIFSEKDLEYFADTEIVTPHALFGHAKIMRMLLIGMANSFDKHLCYSYGCDFAVLNDLILNHRMTDVEASIMYKLTRRKAQKGIISPIKSKHEFDRDTLKIKDGEKGKASPVILNYKTAIDPHHTEFFAKRLEKLLQKSERKNV